MALKWYSMLIFVLLIVMAILSLLKVFDTFTVPMWYDVVIIVLSLIGLILGAAKKKEGGVPPTQ